MCMRYISIQQTIRYSICKISDIACGPPFWTVLVSWYPHHLIQSIHHSWQMNKQLPGTNIRFYLENIDKLKCDAERGMIFHASLTKIFTKCHKKTGI